MENKFHQIMRDRNLTLTKISENTGISKNTLSRISRDEIKMIKFSTIEKLCDYFQIPLSDLLNYQPKRRD